MIDYALIGKKLKDARISNKLTQAELAEELGVSTGYICQIESGDKCFNLKRLREVAEFFEKPVTYFLDGAVGDIRASIISEIIEVLDRMDNEDLEKTKEILNIIAK